MSEPFVLRSSRGGGRLELSVLDEPAGLRVHVALAGLDATGRFYEDPGGRPLGLGPYFASLARDWRGWPGAREWEGIGLTLSAEHHPLGHVELCAILSQPPADAPSWTVRAAIWLEAGQLDGHAREAARLDAAHDSRG